MPLELSLFCDESGSDGLDSRWYLLTLVAHDQSDRIDGSASSYEHALANKGLPNIPFHASPLMYGKDGYKNMPIETRSRLLSSFRVFFRHLPIHYWTLVLEPKVGDTPQQLENRMKRELIEFFFDNLEFLQRYDVVKIYYDNGQQAVADALHKAIDYVLSKEVVVYKLAGQTEYRLSQAADYICTIEFTALKYVVHKETNTDRKFFGSWSRFKKGILKEVRAKRF